MILGCVVLNAEEKSSKRKSCCGVLDSHTVYSVFTNCKISEL